MATLDYEWALTQFETLHLADGVGVMDMLIATTAVARTATLYSFNVKHYTKIAGLNVEQPYKK